MERAYIDDGYTIRTTIPRVAGLHPAVTLEFRPALHQVKEQWQIDTRNAPDGQARTKATTDVVTEYVQSWDIKTGPPSNRPVSPKDPAAVARVQQTLLDKILNYVLGYTAVVEIDAKNSAPASGS